MNEIHLQNALGVFDSRDIKEFVESREFTDAIQRAVQRNTLRLRPASASSEPKPPMLNPRDFIVNGKGERTDDVMELHDAAEAILSTRLRQRVANRIADSRERDLIPAKLPTSEQQAIALIKSTALELQVAGEALDVAARTLLNVTGQGRHAQAAKLAGKRAKDAAEGLIGE